MAVRSALLALLALLVAAGCGEAGGGVIQPEKKGASPMTNQGQAQPPSAGTTP